ncbi:MAG: hypothetical protein QOJ21_688 [Solirubrobacteraceae bacterium]|jgi:predicted glycosyltransferase|nr:hypothetical protein [Solirubrobacteraceae bacterium]
MRRRTVLFHCQHSLGLGHLVRSLALAGSLAERFRVVVLSGGRLPRGVAVPPGVELVALPPMGMTVDGELISDDRRRSAERAMELRRAGILAAHEALRPDVVLVELFPFGRRKFAPELLPLLEAAGDAGALRLCSLRDLLVTSKRDQARHDERAACLANEHFDAVLVHSDPGFARLEESFRPATPLRVPVHYTGFVAPEERAAAPARARAAGQRLRVVVSAGGGRYGGDLLRAAAEAHGVGLSDAGIGVRIIAGPFLPEDEWHALRAAARGRPGLEVRRAVPDLRAEMQAATASVSQCGYNTALDVLRTGVPALVVPFAAGREDEQTRRAQRLEALGAVRVLPADRADGVTLAREVADLVRFRPAPVALDLQGAPNTALFVAKTLARTAAPPPAPRPLMAVAG